MGTLKDNHGIVKRMKKRMKIMRKEIIFNLSGFHSPALGTIGLIVRIA
jgi:hypothetical protein